MLTSIVATISYRASNGDIHVLTVHAPFLNKVNNNIHNKMESSMNVT